MADLLAYGEDIIGFPGGEATAKVKLMDLLWENPNPTQAMAADTGISIDDTNYDLLAYLCFRKSTNNTVIPLVLTPKNKNAYVCYADSLNALQRRFEHTNGTVTAKTGYIGSTVDNTCIILYQIYGIKLEQEIPVVAENVSTLAANCLLSDGETSVEDRLDANTISSENVVSLEYNTEYTTLSDGYFRIACNGGLDTWATGYVNNISIIRCTSVPTQTATGMTSIFVHKGSKIKFDGKNSTDVSGRFYPLS